MVRKSGLLWKCEDLHCYDYQTVSSILSGGVISRSINVTSDVVTKKVITANEFIYEQSVSSRMIRGKSRYFWVSKMGLIYFWKY